MSISLEDPNINTPSAADGPWYGDDATKALPQHFRLNLHDIPCAAAMSAKHYTRRSRLGDGYDRAIWLLYEGNHVRCLREATCYLGNAHERHAVCNYHGSRTQLYVWAPTGPDCELECCTGLKTNEKEGDR